MNTAEEQALKTTIATLSREEVNAMAFGLSLFAQFVMDRYGTKMLVVSGLFTEEDGRRVSEVTKKVQDGVRSHMVQRN